MTREQALARAFLNASVPHLISYHSTVAFKKLVDVAYPVFTLTSEGGR